MALSFTLQDFFLLSDFRTFFPTFAPPKAGAFIFIIFEVCLHINKSLNTGKNEYFTGKD